MTETVSGHELVQTFDCRTPGCTGEARAQSGRHAYCTSCRVARGTAYPDGTPISGKLGVTHTAVPRRSSRKGEAMGAFEERALGLLEAARHVDVAVERYRLARPALETAIAAWRAALNEVAAVDARSAISASSNGDGLNVP